MTTKRPTKRQRLHAALNELWDAIDSGLDHVGHANWPGRQEEALERCRVAYEKVCALVPPPSGAR